MHLPTRLPRRFALLLALAFGLAAVPSPAAADDEKPAQADPAAAYAALVEAFPKPSAEAGFSFLGVIQSGGRRLGYARLAAQPVAGATTPTWETRDQFVFTGAARPRVDVSWAHLGATLAPIRGRAGGNGGATFVWERTSTGFDLRSRPADAESDDDVQRRSDAHAGTALNTMAAMVLFMRHALDRPGTYVTSIYEPEDALEEKPALRPVTIEVLGTHEFQGHPVLAARATKADKTLLALFDKDSKALVGLKLTQGQREIDVLVGDQWSMPARDPVTAGMRAMLGFATKQLGILDDVMHWPTLYATTRARLSEEKRAALPDLETWRKAMLAQWSKRLQERPVPMLQQIIASQRAQIQQAEPDEEGWVRLTFPPMLQGMQLVVGEDEGLWFVMELPPPPGSGKPAEKK